MSSQNLPKPTPFLVLSVTIGSRSVVHPSVVEPNEWLRKKIKVKGIHGDL